MTLPFHLHKENSGRCVGLRIVAFEFDEGFAILSEMRADSLEWEGEDFFYSRIWAG